MKENILCSSRYDSHKKRPLGIVILALFYIIIPILTWVLLFVYFVLLAAIFWIFFFPVSFLIWCCVFFVLSVFYFMAGFGLLFGERWARYLAMILTLILMLINLRYIFSHTFILNGFSMAINFAILCYLVCPKVKNYFSEKDIQTDLYYAP